VNKNAVIEFDSRATRFARGHQHGFTLLELMIVTVIAAILISLAVPALTRFLDTQAIRLACGTLSDGLTYARTEGIRRSAGLSNLVYLGPKCSSSYDAGWAVFQDDPTKASDKCYGAGDTLLQNFDAPSRGTTITFTASTSSETGYVGFNGQGLTRSDTGGFVAGTFTCAIVGSQAPSALVVLNALGRVRERSE
jgi:prepilin-type N-terminal cleavage/methylation domain-containing protein